ncbi:MAG: alpha/beta fold hydrolase [Proteobacteria bacterium]|nr:alpha/beta fold hydrolase [Pseudomonadota bacterium]MDA1063985.1 alpha/beta fold hydrolase [Pseudomonadota bacterium]
MVRSIALGLVLLATTAAADQPASSLKLEDCRISVGAGAPGIAARCGILLRPLDPDDPGKGELELKVAVVPALSLEPASDPFVPIAGGPGQSSIYFYAGWSPAFERVRLQRDILLLDQRGTGASAPLACDVDGALVEGKYLAEQTTRLTEQCLDLLPHDPRYFTTSVAARDLEALRLALGYSQLNLYGILYGSRVAQHYARRYPDATRTVILDGVVPPQLPLGPDIATESQRAIDGVFARCAEAPACNERFPALRDDFALLLGALAEEPITVALQHPVTAKRELVEFSADHFTAAIRLLLYNPGTVALLPLLISDAADGNFAPLAAQFHMVAESLAESLSIGMHNAVLCTEDAPFIDWASVDQSAVNASYMGPVQLEAIRTMCAVWPRGVLDDDLREPLATDKPVLLLSGGAEPITPPYFAALAAVAMRNQWQVVGEQQGHGLAAVGCMPRIIAEFVSAASLADISTDCVQDAFVMPFFIDYTGPTP